MGAAYLLKTLISVARSEGGKLSAMAQKRPTRDRSGPNRIVALVRHIACSNQFMIDKDICLYKHDYIILYMQAGSCVCASCTCFHTCTDVDLC
jgi:hypothetical protein